MEASVVATHSNAELHDVLRQASGAYFELVPPNVAVVGVHFQMVDRVGAAPTLKIGSKMSPSWQPAVVAVASPPSTVYMLHVDKLDSDSVYRVLVALLEDARKVKVMCDVHLAAAWLHAIGDGDDITLRKCVDLQLAYEFCVDPAVRTADMLKIQSSFAPYFDFVDRLEDDPSFVRIVRTDNEDHRLKTQSTLKSATQGVGTRDVPYRMTIVLDDPVNGRLISISGMPEYRNKSVEELRYECSSGQPLHKTLAPNSAKLEQNGAVDSLRAYPVPRRKILKARSTSGQTHPEIGTASSHTAAVSELASAFGSLKASDTKVSSFESKKSTTTPSSFAVDSAPTTPVSSSAFKPLNSTHSSAPASLTDVPSTKSGRFSFGSAAATTSSNVRSGSDASSASAATSTSPAAVRSGSPSTTPGPASTRGAFQFRPTNASSSVFTFGSLTAPWISLGVPTSAPTSRKQPVDRLSLPSQALPTYTAPPPAPAVKRVKAPKFGAPTRAIRGVATSGLSGVISYESCLKNAVSDAAVWSQPEMERMMTDAARQLPCYFLRVLTGHKVSADIFVRTRLRWELAVISNGNRSMWFDMRSGKYQLKSLELLSPIPDLARTEKLVPEVRLDCDIAPLLELLPPRFRSEIVRIADYENSLVDICIDVGRSPHAYTTRCERVLLGAELVCQADVDYVLCRLGGERKIGFDNRAGIDRQLHRVSVMRNKTDEIYGMTLRVGRTLQNAAGVLLDLLLSSEHKHKSILVLGYPGSGKTTLIRDIARCVSETAENVCIIDTSNEIGGDGDVPHACVGFARRMMVKALEQQAKAMVECVQNHAVGTLIVDEIGRKAEVDAAGTVRQRGPRLIASAHGDLQSLIKNQALKGLIGGVQSVTIGDAAAQKAPGKGKVQAARGGNPIFDVIVELDNSTDRGKCQITWNTADAMDSILAGRGYSFETRLLDLDTVGIHEFPARVADPPPRV